MFKAKSNADITMRKEVIITDWDGVLQMIDKAWCYMVKLQEEILNPWFDYSMLDCYGTKEFLLNLFNREEYYLNEWLLKDDVEELPKEAFEFFMKLYAECDFFYEGCDWLSMMEALVNMTRHNFIKEIVILTHVPFSNGRDLRKEKIFKEKIAPLSNKFTLVQLRTDQSKAEWIRDNRPDFTIFIEDRADIIKEVTEKNKMFEKMIYMPVYGYNRYLIEDEEYIQDLMLRNCVLYNYDVQIIPGKENKDLREKFEKESNDLYENLSKRLDKKFKDQFDEIEKMGKFDFDR